MQAKPEQYMPYNLWDVWYQVMNGSRRGVIFTDYITGFLNAKASPYCNWGMLHDTFLPSGYGFALPKGSPYKRFIDNA